MRSDQELREDWDDDRGDARALVERNLRDLKAEQSLSPPSDGWKSAVDGNVFVIGGSALSPSKIGEVVYDNKTPYPLAGASCGRGFSDVGFRLAFSASGGSGSPIDLAKKALPLAKYAAIK